MLGIGNNLTRIIQKTINIISDFWQDQVNSWQDQSTDWDNT
jgi:hypothetical protein